MDFDQYHGLLSNPPPTIAKNHYVWARDLADRRNGAKTLTFPAGAASSPGGAKPPPLHFPGRAGPDQGWPGPT